MRWWACLIFFSLCFFRSAMGLDERRKPLETPPPAPAPPPTLPDSKPPETPKPDDDAPLVKDGKLVFNGIVFVKSKDEVQKESPLKGVHSESIPMLDHDDFRKDIEPFVGKTATLKIIKEVAKAVILYYRKNDRPFVDVTVPEQDITKGVLHILVLEAKLGKITVEGNKYYRNAQYLDRLDLTKGEAISEKELIAAMTDLNQSSFRTVKPVFKKGAEPGETDLTLKAEERFPVRFYTGYEDTGTKLTGLDRWLYGFNWGNGFMHEHEIGYQFSTNYDFDKIWSHSGYWRIPMPNRRDKLSFTGGYSRVHADINQDLSTVGTSWQASMRYISTLPSFGTYHHEIQGGVDYKQTSNKFIFGRDIVYQSLVHTSQFAATYSGYQSDSTGVTQFSINGVWSPGRLADHETLFDYRNSRAGTDSKYHYGNINLERIWHLPKQITLMNRLNGQVTSQRLQGTEQMQIGGYNSVRGWNDREFSSDEGLTFTAELRSPDFMLGKFYDKSRFENRLQLCVFYDYGATENLSVAAGELKHLQMASIGGGVRYRLGKYFSLRFDYGYRIKKPAGSVDSDDNGRIHLGVVGSF